MRCAIVKCLRLGKPPGIPTSIISIECSTSLSALKSSEREGKSFTLSHIFDSAVMVRGFADRYSRFGRIFLCCKRI